MKIPVEIDGNQIEIDVPDDATDEEIDDIVNAEQGGVESDSVAEQPTETPGIVTINGVRQIPKLEQGKELKNIGNAIASPFKAIWDVGKSIPAANKAMVTKPGEYFKGVGKGAGQATLDLTVNPVLSGIKYAATNQFFKENANPIQLPKPQTDAEALGVKFGSAGTNVATFALPAGKIASALKTAPEQTLANSMRKGVEKGIKPKVVNKGSFSKMDDFYNSTESAVKSISENRNALNILDESGEQVIRPRTAGEMAQAVEQTKKLIFKRYNDLAVQAGDNGAMFNAKPIINKLEEIANPEGKFRGNSDAQKYAQSLIDDMEALDGAAPDIVQERIREYNESLAGYYAGRAEKVKSRIDASIANAMREQLDNQITNAVGDGYQGLKNEYGALKAIEKEVNHRALINARAAGKNVLDMTDIFTGADLAGGILSMNPVMIARGAAGKAIAQWYKNVNKPDNYINKMFDNAYKVYGNEPVLKAGETFSPNLNIPAFARKGITPDVKSTPIITDERRMLPAPMLNDGKQAFEPMLPSLADRVRAMGQIPEPPKIITDPRYMLPAPMVETNIPGQSIKPPLPSIGDRVRSIGYEGTKKPEINIRSLEKPTAPQLPDDYFADDPFRASLLNKKELKEMQRIDDANAKMRGVSEDYPNLEKYNPDELMSLEDARAYQYAKEMEQHQKDLARQARKVERESLSKVGKGDGTDAGLTAAAADNGVEMKMWADQLGYGWPINPKDYSEFLRRVRTLKKYKK